MEPSNNSNLLELLNTQPILVPDINYHKISIAPMLVSSFVFVISFIVYIINSRISPMFIFGF